MAKPIDMVVWFTKEGVPNPVRFRIINEDQGETVIRVGRVVTRDIEKCNGNIMYIFKCESCIGGHQKIFELKYELDTCKWILWKISSDS
jgi:hypothetical protein